MTLICTSYWNRPWWPWLGRKNWLGIPWLSDRILEMIPKSSVERVLMPDWRRRVCSWLSIEKLTGSICCCWMLKFPKFPVCEASFLKTRVRWSPCGAISVIDGNTESGAELKVWNCFCGSSRMVGRGENWLKDCGCRTGSSRLIGSGEIP